LNKKISKNGQYVTFFSVMLLLGCLKNVVGQRLSIKLI